MTTDQLRQLILNLARTGRLPEAEQLCRQAVSQKPEATELADLLGQILNQLAINCIAAGQIDEAERRLSDALVLFPKSTSVLNNLGGLRLQQRRFPEAVELLLRSLAIQADHFDTLLNLGLAYLELAQPEHSIEMYFRAEAQATALPADHRVNAVALAKLMLAGVYRWSGNLDEALAQYRHLLLTRPSAPQGISGLLYTLNLSDRISPKETFESHVELVRPMERVSPISSSADVRSGGTLRIGFVSSDFRHHAVGSFLPAALNLNANHFETFCYASVSDPDEMTERYKANCAHWRNIAPLTDSAAADCVENDQIDVLIDLNGHTAGNRLALFPYRKAPLQVTWLGYPNTTGLASMDYRITDSLADPPGLTESFHTEKLLRLDPCFLCFVPPQNPPAVQPTPAMRSGFITFGSFNDYSKIQPETLRQWAALLSEVPDSRLTIKCRQMDSASCRRQITQSLAALGVSSDRVVLIGRDRSTHEHLQRYAEIDIALDTYPYHGTTTTCEALYMGVPVLSRLGLTHVSRVSASLLNAVGLNSLATDNVDRFATMGKSLSSDMAALARLRAELRDRVLSSALCDQKAFALRFENLLLRISTGSR